MAVTDMLLLSKADGWYDKVNMQRRLYTSINDKADYRYEELLVKYPEFIKRFPQHIIAFYLGISKENLSRISPPGNET
jgi:hypothetical protein